MSKVEGTKQSQVQAEYQSPSPPVKSRQNGGQNETAVTFTENNDTPREKFYAREGIERGRGNHYGQYKDKKVGDEVEIETEGGKKHGRILKDTGETLEVIVGDTVYVIDKNTGKCRGQRQASAAEMRQAQQWEQIQQQQADMQEQQSQRLDESIKENNRKDDLRIEAQRIETRLVEQELIERAVTKRITPAAQRQDANQSLSIQFQTSISEPLRNSLSVSEIILAKDKEAETKNLTY